jgi:hypothetical protein
MRRSRVRLSVAPFAHPKSLSATFLFFSSPSSPSFLFSSFLFSGVVRHLRETFFSSPSPPSSASPLRLLIPSSLFSSPRLLFASVPPPFFLFFASCLLSSFALVLLFPGHSTRKEKKKGPPPAAGSGAEPQVSTRSQTPSTVSKSETTTPAEVIEHEIIQWQVSVSLGKTPTSPPVRWSRVHPQPGHPTEADLLLSQQEISQPSCAHDESDSDIFPKVARAAAYFRCRRGTWCGASDVPAPHW